MTFPCCPVDDPCPDHGGSTFAERHAAAQAERDDRMGVPGWARGEPHIPEDEVQAG